ncbi:MAG: beta-L-arabinofuranosidase domain-containing protein, partial [Thermoguttaceae bacterium]
MKPALVLTAFLLSFIATIAPAFADALADDGAKVKVAPVVPLKVHAFPLWDVRLLDGPFKHAMELDEKYLLSLDVDRLLHNFRVNASLPSSAQPLGGWEEPNCELRGHFVGHYLSACAMMYAATGEEKFKQKGDAVVAGLAECQAKIGTGYLSAFPESFFDRVESTGRVWAPYYTLHKIYAGLLDMYVYCDNRQALEVCKRFADWVIARNAKLSDEQMQKMLRVEHGGMNEVLANLYALTGEEKYLKIAQRFNHMAVLSPASKQEDKLNNLHANTQIPKFIGVARQYELTGQDRLGAAARFFWDTVVKERSYVIGGNSNGEKFSPKETLSKSLGPNTTETCNTYNMLKLTRHLFCLNPLAEYADYYERALINHILASQNPADGMMCYYVPLRSGSHKDEHYSTPLNTFACCTGTGVENHAKYGDSIYYHDENNLYLNLFIASELNWKAKGLKLRQETQYPDEGASKLAFTCDKPVELALRVRHPWWAVKGFEIRVNGEKQADSSRPGSYAAVSRVWKSGDSVEISMPFSLYTEGFRDNPRRFAFMNGPLVLCAEVDMSKPFPAIVAEDGRVLDGVKPVADKPNTFSGSAEEFRIPGETDGKGVTLEPFYKMQGARRYIVYWDQFTPAEWQASGDYPIKPVPFTAVHLSDVFWAPRIEINRTVTIPFAFEQCEKSGRMDNFERAAAALKGEELKNKKSPGFPFDDTDPYKVLEGASYALAVKPDPKMKAYLDELIAKIGAAQEPDGYLYTARTINPQHPHDWSGPKRWLREADQSHELYNAGHLFEAAAAHYQATGERNLLDIAIKEANLLCDTFGPDKLHIWPGHEIVEMGLVKLYRVTGDRRYLDLAKFFLDVRGPGGDEYHQSRVKPVDQTEAVGHAVRAAYMYSGMADVAAMTGDKGYLNAIDAIWENVVGKKLYITGGIGALGAGEAFGKNY